MGMQRQEMSVNAVDFDGQNYLSQTSEPTEHEVDEQYTKYLNVDPEDSPNHVGYALPNRVAFEYLEIPRDQVERAVDAGIDGKNMQSLLDAAFGTLRAATVGRYFVGAGLYADDRNRPRRPFEAVREEVHSGHELRERGR